jgi:hypothetical protein
MSNKTEITIEKSEKQDKSLKLPRSVKFILLNVFFDRISVGGICGKIKS